MHSPRNSERLAYFKISIHIRDTVAQVQRNNAMERHVTVLIDEAVKALAINESSVVVDATLGACGHTRAITALLGTNGTYIGIDADSVAVTQAPQIIGNVACTTHFITDNFRRIDSIVHNVHQGNVDAILADLGWRMEQFSGNGKGFSFQIDEPLIMTYGDSEQYAFTAHDIVNEWEEEQIVSILRGYGEERFAGRIARHIVEAREVKPIDTTFELVAIIESAVPLFYKRARLHCATRTFQALRITVNDEFSALEEFLAKAITVLAPKGRLAIITFHSMEDRIVKHTFKNFTHDQTGILVTKKPITPSITELQANPRARSAKLRIFEKL